MKLADTSLILQDGMTAALAAWAAKLDGERDALYWLLVVQNEAVDGHRDPVLQRIPEDLRADVSAHLSRADAYFADVRYAALDPAVRVWGTVVNALRVAAETDRATELQKATFDFSAESLVALFVSARDRMEVADSLYHAFRAMPAPECQALAALLNVHVDARLDVETLCRLVRLLDHEGPMSAEETRDLASIARTNLVDAAFRGLRARA